MGRVWLPRGNVPLFHQCFLHTHARFICHVSSASHSCSWRIMMPFCFPLLQAGAFLILTAFKEPQYSSLSILTVYLWCQFLKDAVLPDSEDNKPCLLYWVVSHMLSSSPLLSKLWEMRSTVFILYWVEVQGEAVCTVLYFVTSSSLEVVKNECNFACETDGSKYFPVYNLKLVL